MNALLILNALQAKLLQKIAMFPLFISLQGPPASRKWWSTTLPILSDIFSPQNTGRTWKTTGCIILWQTADGGNAYGEKSMGSGYQVVRSLSMTMKDLKPEICLIKP